MYVSITHISAFPVVILLTDISLGESVDDVGGDVSVARNKSQEI